MEKLDLLISKFKEFKEEIEKSDSSPLHSTVEGFMGGLKTLPKGSAERGKFITSHMNHAPFISALNAHPQGKQMHTMLMGHLNSATNAGPKAYGGAKVSASSTAPVTPIKKSADDELDEFLEKAYFSPWLRFGSSKKIMSGTPSKSNKPTGIDKIKAVSQEKISPTSVVSEDRKRAASTTTPSNPTNANKPAPKLTGIDKIKAESQKPIIATTVKKDEDEEEKDLKKGLFSSASPKKSFVPSFQGHKAALGIGSTTNAKGVTTERSFDPLKQQTSQKKYVNLPFGKTVNGSMGMSVNGENNMAMSCDEKMTLNKNGQWNLEKNKDQKSVHCEGKTCKETRSVPDQNTRTCGCSCKGCNPPINKMDGGDMSCGSGV